MKLSTKGCTPPRVICAILQCNGPFREFIYFFQHSHYWSLCVSMSSNYVSLAPAPVGRSSCERDGAGMCLCVCMCGWAAWGQADMQNLVKKIHNKRIFQEQHVTSECRRESVFSDLSIYLSVLNTSILPFSRSISPQSQTIPYQLLYILLLNSDTPSSTKYRR